MTELVELAKETIEIEIDALRNGIKNINDTFSKIIIEISNIKLGGRVIITGMGKSGHIGKKIAATLSSTGTSSFFVHPAEAGHGDLGMINPQDLIITISQSGKSEEILKLVPFFKRNGNKIICMTGDLTSPLSKFADYTISTEVNQEACPLGLAPTSSTTLTLAMGDALAVCLLKYKGFSKNDFALTHPLGSLGKKLLSKITDIMSIIEDTPYINPDANIKEAIYAISSKGLGFVVVVNDNLIPIGIFTDGDLRRALNQEIDIMNEKIKDLMVKKFTTIENIKLSVEAVKLMSDNKILMLPVIDSDGRLCGAINMRQLIQAGVI